VARQLREQVATLRAQIARQTQAIARHDKDLEEATRIAETNAQRAAAAEERLRRRVEKDAVQNKTFEKLMAQVEANLAAATARADRAERRVAELDRDLGAERARCAQLEEQSVSLADFPDWPAARRCIVAQRAQLHQARAKAREASGVLRVVFDSAATHLVELAKNAKQTKEFASLMLSLDQVFEGDDLSSGLHL
jgi:chromosome segregation ATPase